MAEQENQGDDSNYNTPGEGGGGGAASSAAQDNSVNTSNANAQGIAQDIAAQELQQELLSDLPSDVARLLQSNTTELTQSINLLRRQLQVTTTNLITQRQLNQNTAGALRYSELLFLPIASYPSASYYWTTGTNPTNPANSVSASDVPWAYAPTVEIYAHTTSAPEFGLVDQLIEVQDASGDGYGFEEVQGQFSTTTSTFNISTGNNHIGVRLDRRLFAHNGDCYAGERTYKLHYASGHVQTIMTTPPSPCYQSDIRGQTKGTTTHGGWDHSYCYNEDYKSRRNATRMFSWSGPSQYTTLMTMVQNWLPGGVSKFDWAATGFSPQVQVTTSGAFQYDIGTNNLGGIIPNKASTAEDIYSLLGLSLNNTVSVGSPETGAPLQLMDPQVTRQDYIFLSDTLPPGSLGPNPAGGSFDWVDNGYNLVQSLEASGTPAVLNASGNDMAPEEGSYGVIRNYTYSENLTSCYVAAQIDIEVCTDNGSPSFYLTTQEDCDGNDITNYINGTNGSWNPIPGGPTCCTIDCTSFIMSATSEDSDYNGNNGEIHVDFTNGTGTPVGNPDTTAGEHAYDISLVHSNGTAITQNGNSAYASGASFTASCNTTVNSSLVSCSSNASITIGMSVTGTGVTGTAYVGEITGGTPGAVTQFRLSSSATSNTPVISSGAQTNTTLTFAISQYRFHWGSLAPTTGGAYYILTVTDDDGCIYTQNIVINEAAATTGCITAGSINQGTYNLACNPDCCLLCDTVSGQVTNTAGSIIGDAFVANATSTPTTGPAASAGSISLNGGPDPLISGFLTNTMSYKYTLYLLTVQGDFSTAGSALATATSTLAQGITAAFTSLAWGYYGIKIEIEDSSTGSDEKLEKCFQWKAVDVQSPVCDDPLATTYNTTVPTPLRIPDATLCTYPQGCFCIHTGTSINAVGCSFEITHNVVCDPWSSIQSTWTFPDGTTTGPITSNLSQFHIFTLPASQVTASGIYTLTITDNGQGGTCTQDLTANITLPVCGCMDSLAINYDPLATVDDGSCVYCVYGCMDPNAPNYNPSATCDDGTCIVPYGGCTDPTADNYDAGATFDDGSCIWTGCTDIHALNYLHNCSGTYNANINNHDPACCNYCTTSIMDPIITIDATVTNALTCAANADGLAKLSMASNPNGCTTWAWTVMDTQGTVVYSQGSINVTGGVGSTGNILAVGAYHWEVTDCSGCITSGSFSIGSNSATCGCTDPNASNYDPNATLDDGSCIYPGCTDPNAANYNPNAFPDDGTCTYTIAANPCSLTSATRRKLDLKMFGCLTLKGAMYLNKLRIGYADDCSIMNQWKLILVNYLLQKHDLDCMYNCSDDMSTLPAGTQTCNDLATTGGPVTGLNDQGYAGSTYSTTTGTVITNPNLYFVQANQLWQGDVITMPSGLVWEMTMAGNCTFGCYNPESAQGQNAGHWKQCTPLSNFTNSYTTNYIDPFIKFLNEQCDKCTEDPTCVSETIQRKVP